MERGEVTQHKKRFQALSLFSGGMGFDIGLFQTGRFEIKACVEKVPAFCETIRRNRDSGRIDPHIKVYEGDIKKLDPSQVMADLQIEKGEIDVVVGGPPCQSFSTAGRRGTVQDPRGSLLWEFLRFVDSMRPKMFLMENVRGLMSAAVRHRQISERPDKGGPPLAVDEQPGSVIRLYLGDLHDQYRMDCFEVNAVNYGVPQMRERVIFIGNRYNRIVDFPRPTHANVQPDNSEWFTSEENRMKPFSTIGEALNGLNEKNPVVLDFSPRKKSYLSMIPPGGNWR
ncbi:MAG: DNA cytosine methyltransferase, partial [Candidatus Thermoplasmatota archaeon]|nr:DNA cytosine methyltransferase [Candidatus Thermoplasmatota archaeon]